MSSTIFGADRLRKELGIKDKYEFISMPSKFPVENRKVFSFPVATMNYATSTDKVKMAQVSEVVKDICMKHNKSNDSGIIFTPSYSLAKTIFDNIKDSLRKEGMIAIINTSSSDRNDMLEKFKNENDKRNKVLISPSFSEGVNFENDFSRFQIIPKVPYLSLGSRYVSEKLKRDHVWYAIAALTTLIQSSGRSIRNIDDFATTYVLDTNFQKLIKQYQKYIPSWYADSIFTKN
jgi:Rad3-related DNA helicase